ncbi:molybdopterin cofactor-binding domain-containing protein [Pyruvatibacter mobilis]|uniref:xanthine dehydrogenase family protein molybdopterin-binding subunit n=1 Tax=Pyruvatibacter mobilis TaxID=1712261 RepID=UPI003BAD57AE
MNKWSRRAFIGAGVAGGAALVVGVAIRPGNPVDSLAKDAAVEGEQLINAWVKIGEDNVVTAITPHTEMGQGALSTLAQMLADEMDADWDKVEVMSAPANGDYVSSEMARLFVAPDLDVGAWLEPTVDGVFKNLSYMMDLYLTGGSFSIRSTGQRGMRVAGAAAKEMLVAAAADAWDVPAGEITTEKSRLYHKASGKSADYAEFAVAAADQSLPAKPTLKTVDEFKLMGTSAQRLDIPSKVNGTAQYGIDATVPGQKMKYAAVLSSPVPGAVADSMDDTEARSMRGVETVLNMGSFIAVVADSYWHAQQAVNAVSVTYSQTPTDGLDQAGMFATFDKALNEAGANGGDTLFEQGNTGRALEKASTVIEAEYQVPFLAHACMEPMNCTVWIRDGKADFWLGTQAPLRCRTAAADILDLGLDDITIHMQQMGGGFGRRSATDMVEMAARVAKEVGGGPLKLIWSREEDIQKAAYRNATTSRFRGGLDEAGKPVAWDNVFLFHNDPADASFVSYYDTGSQHIRALSDVDLPLPFWAWRSVDHSQHGFFVESFVDEMAQAAGKDPVEFRLSMLGNSPRFATVLKKAAAMADWGSAQPAGHGRGVALVRSFNTIVAMVAEVDMTRGAPRVRKVFCCADPGYAMNPDGFTAQMEGGIIYGLTAALHGEISIRNGAVEQSNFHDYEMVRMDEAPDIVVEIINGNPEDIGGGGEPGTPPIAPAVANAIFNATGVRPRKLPLSGQSFSV